MMAVVKEDLTSYISENIEHEKNINQQEEIKNDFVFSKRSHLVSNIEVDHEILLQRKR